MRSPGCWQAAAVVVGAPSLAVGFRHARGTKRQQLRWVARAAVLASLAS